MTDSEKNQRAKARWFFSSLTIINRPIYRPIYIYIYTYKDGIIYIYIYMCIYIYIYIIYIKMDPPPRSTILDVSQEPVMIPSQIMGRYTGRFIIVNEEKNQRALARWFFSESVTSHLNPNYILYSYIYIYIYCFSLVLYKLID